MKIPTTIRGTKKKANADLKNWEKLLRLIQPNFF